MKVWELMNRLALFDPTWEVLFREGMPGDDGDSDKIEITPGFSIQVDEQGARWFTEERIDPPYGDCRPAILIRRKTP